MKIFKLSYNKKKIILIKYKIKVKINNKLLIKSFYLKLN